MSTLQHLYEASVKGTITDREHQQMLNLLADPENGPEALQLIREGLNNRYGPEERIPAEKLNGIMQSIFSTGQSPEVYDPAIQNSSIHRIHFLKTTWFRYAAALLLMVGTATFLYRTYKKPEQQTAENKTLPQPDIQAGGNKAILTLADGSSISLDSADNGTLTQQGNSRVVKLANGQIVYQQKNLPQGVIMMNTLSTPRGGQYQLTLPDGSKVWLNAASSITYPTTFTGVSRNVKITGEVYFEIAKDKTRPFFIKMPGTEEVEVLGTSFNINAYADEDVVRTTLIEGSVRINAYHHLQLLKPGEQSSCSPRAQKIQVQTANLNQVMAWKNGVFDFNKVSLAEAMRQLAKWYDVEVVYEKGIPAITFWGKMGRNLSLSEVLESFDQAGVHFRLGAGRRLIVTIPDE